MSAPTWKWTLAVAAGALAYGLSPDSARADHRYGQSYVSRSYSSGYGGSCYSQRRYYQPRRSHSSYRSGYRGRGFSFSFSYNRHRSSRHGFSYNRHRSSRHGFSYSHHRSSHRGFSRSHRGFGRRSRGFFGRH